jgi:hypothetical protein
MWTVVWSDERVFYVIMMCFVLEDLLLVGVRILSNQSLGLLIMQGEKARITAAWVQL